MKLPTADEKIGLRVLRALARQRHLLAAMSTMYQCMGNVFQITLPRFNPAVFVGPEANREIMVTGRAHLSWRTENDPVVKLLRRGVLVVDGEEHDQLRSLMDPPLYRRESVKHLEMMWQQVDRVTEGWQDDTPVDMLIEMRKITLLILVQALFGVDFMPDMERMWQSVLGVIKYISPGLWILWPKLPRWGYGKAIKQMDEYLYGIIAKRRLEINDRKLSDNRQDDLLGQLIVAGLDDNAIRDQMLTMLIAGHDTSTALLAWVFYLLGSHPDTLVEIKAEVDEVLGNEPPQEHHLQRLSILDGVIKETLRLYPPIHVGNRRAACPTTVQGYEVPEGLRVMASIYLTHRDETVWEDPEKFCPHRFGKDNHQKRPAFSYIPFGGGPRNCIGAAFATVEVKVVLARILHQFDLELLGKKVHLHMGATLEPRPGVIMRVTRRANDSHQ
ncbi:MAG: cytochrome P450 [Caldilinea sp. CFX5]|nr:cytochrome P450 [Caldilinea sp. CFX5]